MFSLYVLVTKKRPFFVSVQKQVKVKKKLSDNVEAMMRERKTVRL